MKINIHSLFKTNKTIKSCFLFVVLLNSLNFGYAQCGFQSTCSNSNYLNFGVGSNTDASTIEFDNFVSGYHQTLVRTSEGVYKTWGQSMGNNGTTDVLSPTIINNTNYPALTGTVLKAGVGSTSSTSAQAVLLSTTGLFAWGKMGITIPPSITSSTTFQKLTINGKTDGLPVGVNPLDVKMLFTTWHTVALLTCTGEVWVLTQQGENTGTGLTGTLSTAAENIWYRVTETTAGNPNLSNVIQLRGTANALVALKKDGTLWTWGTQTYLGNASAQTSRNRATQMTLPTANPIKMIGVTRNKVTSGTSYYLLNADGNLYALGENSNKQLGDWTNTDRTSWVQPKYTSADGPVMNNIRWISPQEHDENYGNINIINSVSTNYNWGVANGDMLGRGGTTDFDPGIPNGITAADEILAVETGGHTSMLSKKCEDYFGYVGHRTNGSMGDGTTNATTESSYTFLTAVVYICGATSASVDVTGTPTLSANGLYCNGTSTDLLPTPAGGTLSILSGPGTLSGTVLTFTGTGNTKVTVKYVTTVSGCSAIVKQATIDLFTEDCVLPCTIGTPAGSVAVQPTCGTPTGTIVFTTQSGVEYSIDGTTYQASATFTGVASGTYTLKVRSTTDNTCVTTGNAVTVNAQPATPVQPTLGAVTQPTCTTATGSFAISNYNAAYTYVFTPSTGVVNTAGTVTAPAGSYTITATLGACTSTAASVTIDAQPLTPVQPTLGTVTQPTCSTATGSFVISNYNAAYTYAFTPSTGVTNTAGTVTAPAGTYTVMATLGACTSTAASVTVNVKPNCTPIAVDDTYTVAEDSSVILTPLLGDSDADGDVLSITSINGTVLIPGTAQVIPVSNGTVKITAGGVITFTPDLNYNSLIAITFPYVISDGKGGNATANETITVTPVNDAPIVDNDVNTTTEDTPTVGGDLTDEGDSDPDGSALIVTTTPVSGPSNGTIVINADGTYVYTPNLNFNGVDVITVEVCDSGTPLPKRCVNQTLTITVTPVNDSPIVDNDVNATAEDTPTVGGDLTDEGDSDPDGTALVVTTTPVSGPSNGSIVINADGTYVYTPNLNFNGIDVITVEVCDQGLPLPKACVNQTLTITVVPINDAPIVDNDVNTTAEDTPTVGGDLTDDGDSDPDGSALIVTTTPVSGPSNGTILINADGTYVYTPNPNFNGTDVITVEICDSGTPLPKRCVNQTLTITVTPVNDEPIVDNDVNTTTEDTPTVGGDLTDEGDSDPDGTALVVTTTPVSGPSNGTILINADGTYVYTPNTNFNGTDVVTVEVCDSGTPLPKSCVNQTLTITVTPVNDAPIVDNDVNTTNEDEPTLGGDLTDAGDSDPDGTPLVVTTTPVSGPTNGTIVINADGTYVYTPNINFNGIDVITVEVCDSGTPLPKMCVNQTLTITVTPVNDPPVANNDSDTTLSDTNVIITVASNDTDIDGTINTTTIDLNPSLSGQQTTLTVADEGTYTVNANGTVTFDPLPSFSGTTTPVNYTIQDNQGGVSNIATITVVVGVCVNNPILDCDGDGVKNGQEVLDGTNPLDQCSFILSNVSLVPSANWSAADCDNDGLTNGKEVALGTNPLNPDTDGDGVLDGKEVSDGTNPLDQCSFKFASIKVVPSANWSNADCDNDGLKNGQEITIGTDPLNPDTDGDGVLDGIEVADGTKPLDPCDSIEEHITVQQSVIFLNGDCDGDGLLNHEEIGTDPAHPFDSNGDGIPDYLELNNHKLSNAEDDLEIFNGVSPTSDDAKNNVFTIRNIEKYPNNTLEIYNRWGVLVYEASGYGQGNKFFKGESEGRVTISTAQQLPEETYYYVLKYVKSDGTVKQRTGYLYINR